MHADSHVFIIREIRLDFLSNYDQFLLLGFSNRRDMFEATGGPLGQSGEFCDVLGGFEGREPLAWGMQGVRRRSAPCPSPGRRLLNPSPGRRLLIRPGA